MAMDQCDMASADQVHSDHMMVSNWDRDMVEHSHDMNHESHEHYH